MAHRYTRPSATADEQLAALLQVLTIQQRQIDVLLERPQEAPVTSHSVASRPATSHSGVRGRARLLSRCLPPTPHHTP